MVFRGRLDGVEAMASLKSSSVSIALGEGYVVAWDLGGRLYSTFKHGQTTRRGLNGRVLHKWRDTAVSPGGASPYDQRQRAVLSEAEADSLLDETAALSRLAVDAIAGNPASWPDEAGRPAGADLIDALGACSRFDAAAAREDAAQFSRVYSPIGILPPDQYLSVVLQATTGCSFNTCTFCDLYHGDYRVKTPAEFARHVAEVREYLGPSLSLRGQSVFLGAANALAVPTPRLADLLAIVRNAFPGSQRTVCSFVDGFTGARKDAGEYRQLAALGLTRVYIGLESGHDPLLAFVRKPGTSANAIDTARTVKAAGIAVGLIVMIGLGGRQYSGPHVADTVAAVNAMGLGAGDLVYFSDLVEVPGTAYPDIAADARLAPLTLPERISQLDAIRAELAFPGPLPKFARYDIREFVY